MTGIPGMRKEVSVDQVEKILSMTDSGFFRSEIAEATGLSKTTVYLYQKKFC